MRIIRLLEDYIPETSEPPNPNHIPRYKRDLLIEVDASKDGWLLLKRMEAADSVASWVPSEIAIEAQPGLYRLRQGITNASIPASQINVAQGELIKVIDTKYRDDIGMQQWRAKLLDGSNRTILLRAPWLEPVDVESPPDLSTERAPKEPRKNVLKYFNWSRGHVMREPRGDEHGLLAYCQNARGVTEEEERLLEKPENAWQA